MPFFHSLKKNTLSGQMFVSVFAGGTASTEFEALTSNSMAYIPNGITAYTTYINSPMTSLASTLKAQGYGGIIAMHPYKEQDISVTRFILYWDSNNSLQWMICRRQRNIRTSYF